MALRITILLALVVLAGCGASPSRQSGAVAAASSSPAAASPSPSPSPSPAAATAPSTATEAPPPPTTTRVYFSGLPAGEYITHLHSVCNGAQAFHIVVLETLDVGGGGTGSITAPPSYFGRGLCVIVYANPSLSRVLTTQQI